MEYRRQAGKLSHGTGVQYESENHSFHLSHHLGLRCVVFIGLETQPKPWGLMRLQGRREGIGSRFLLLGLRMVTLPIAISFILDICISWGLQVGAFLTSVYHLLTPEPFSLRRPDSGSWDPSFWEHSACS